MRDTILAWIGSHITNPAFSLCVDYNPQGHDDITKAVFRITHSGEIDERGKAHIHRTLEQACFKAAYMARNWNVESWFNDEKFER